MSFSAFRQDLLKPTRWFPIICAIAGCVNLHEELVTLVALKIIVTEALRSASRSLLS